MCSNINTNTPTLYELGVSVTYKEGEISHINDINIVWQYNIIQEVVINGVLAETFLPLWNKNIHYVEELTILPFQRSLDE